MTSTTPPPSRYATPLNFPSSPVSFPSPSSSASSNRGNKRKQVKNACVNCQKACKKCDDQRPCSRCVKYGIEDGCTNSQRKERKRKPESGNEDEPKMSSSTRIQLNFSSSSSRRLRTDAASEDQDPTTSQRFSSRNGIRPFPKELLESLQDEHTRQAPSVVASMCPQLTEEFKTLARICSDLHTVISQPVAQILPLPTLPNFRYSPHQSPPPPNFLYQRINPFGLGTNGIPRSVSPPQFQKRVDTPMAPFVQMSQMAQFNNHIYQQQQQQQQQHLHVPIQIRRPNSPSEHLLKPSSPIYNTFHQHQNQQGIPRNLMNRTPPEDEPSNEFNKEPI